MHTTDSSASRVAVAQIGAKKFDHDFNQNSVIDAVREAADDGIDLVVFPECILTAYLYDSAEETSANAIPLDSKILHNIENAHLGTRVHSVVGFLERDGDDVFNSAALFGPDGLIGTYRKQHLPFLGADRFVTAGQGETSPLFDTAIGRIGIMVCFDLRFPEVARELALQGADIIAMPTNWAGASTILPDIVVRVRALENLVYLAVADRPDEESGRQFVGRSQIITPRGEVLVDAGEGTGLYAVDVALGDAREKRIVLEPGEFELPIFEGRRPELYRHITEPIDANIATSSVTEGR